MKQSDTWPMDANESTPVAKWYLLYLLRYWLLVQFPVLAKLSQKNCVNYQLDNLLIKGVVGSTIKTRQPKNVGDDGWGCYLVTVYDTASHTPDEVRCDVVESSSHGVHGGLPFGDRAEHRSPEGW